MAKIGTQVKALLLKINKATQFNKKVELNTELHNLQRRHNITSEGTEPVRTWYANGVPILQAFAQYDERYNRTSVLKGWKYKVLA